MPKVKTPVIEKQDRLVADICVLAHVIIQRISG